MALSRRQLELLHSITGTDVTFAQRLREVLGDRPFNEAHEALGREIDAARALEREERKLRRGS